MPIENKKKRLAAAEHWWADCAARVGLKMRVGGVRCFLVEVDPVGRVTFGVTPDGQTSEVERLRMLVHEQRAEIGKLMDALDIALGGDE